MKLEDLRESADKASSFLKSLANPQRLRIMCLIMEQERPVGELAEAVELNQSAVSQHLALMRREGLLKTRREGQTIYYQLADRNVTKFFGLLDDMFCKRK
jgi:ArsR family transcriptional regulator, virulence genes transcriptional regulator